MQFSRPLRVMLADDHTLLRSGLRAVLQQMPGIEVVAEASNGAEALALIESQQPDIALMDISMNGLDGLETTARATQQFPSVRILILSMHASEAYILRALRSGASGYLLKDSGTSELENALHRVAQGEIYLSPAVSHIIATDYARRNSATKPALELSPRQLEVLQFIARGFSTQQIASHLVLSVKTVESHRSQIMERLNIRDVAGLVRYAIRNGLIESDE